MKPVESILFKEGEPIIAVGTKEAAEFLGISCCMMVKMLADGTGPRFIKSGRTIIFFVNDLIAFREGKKSSST